MWRWISWMNLGLSLLTGLIVFTGILPLFRPAVVLIFYVTCPGLAFVGLLRLRDFLTELVLMVALSLVIDSVVAMLLLYTGAWSYVTGLLVIIGISVVGALAGMREGSPAGRTPNAETQYKPLPARASESLPSRVDEPARENRMALPSAPAQVENRVETKRKLEDSRPPGQKHSREVKQEGRP